MSTNTCGCGAPVHDSYLCRICTRQLREALTDLAPGRSLLPGHAIGTAGRGTSTRWDAPSAVVVGGLAGHLDTTVARLARIGDRSSVAGGEKPVNFHEKGAQIRTLLVGTLAPWAEALLESERPTVQPPGCRHRSTVGVDCPCVIELAQAHTARRTRWAGTLAAVRAGNVGATATYLLRHMIVIEGDAAAPQLHAAVLDAVRRVERIIDREPERVAAGECGAELPDERLCRKALYVDPEEPFVICPACKTRWSVAERRAWLLAAAQDSLGNAATIATALTRLDQPVTPERIRKWKERGKLTPHGNEPPPPCRDHQGRGRQPQSCEACRAKVGAPLYRLGDVVDLLTDAMSAASRRSTKQAS